MTAAFLEYKLQDGFINNWVVAGPLTSPVQGLDLATKSGPADKKEMYRQRYHPELDIEGEIADQYDATIEGKVIPWRYVRCKQDHYVDLSTSLPSWQHLKAWACSTLRIPDSQMVSFVLTTSGPADVWINEQHVLRQEDFYEGSPGSTSFQAQLQTGDNRLIVRFEQITAGVCPFTMALKLSGAGAAWIDEIDVRIPTKAKRPHRQIRLENLFEYAYLDEVVNYRGAHFNLRWAEDLKEEVRYNYQIQDSRNRVYVEGTWTSDPEKPNDVGHTYRLYERPLFVVLKAPIKELFEDNLRYEQRMPLHILDNSNIEEPRGTFPERFRAALEDASKHETDIYSEVARLFYHQTADANVKLVLSTIDNVNQRTYGSQRELLALLGMLARYQENPSFPAELIQPLEDCALGYRYWLDEPGTDALSFSKEDERLMAHACELLAGQLFPEKTFSNSGQKGSWHQAKAEKLVTEWLLMHGQGGFTAWNSPQVIDHCVAALAQLTNLSKDETIQELSAILLDKIFFFLAVHTFRGANGSTHAEAATPMLKSAQLSATASLARTFFGMGVFNHHIAGVVSLVTSNYEYPTPISDIAQASPEEMWSLERHVSNPNQPDQGEQACIAVYKTPDYMLSAALDYHPGENGHQEHIWQATLGSEAVVFTNHPGNMSDNDYNLPGFWSGNRLLPRAAQWKDVFVAVYRLPEDDWMGYTHAYFPTYAFDEVAFEGGWAFARRGSGYLALSASGGFELQKRVPDGYRELRTPKGNSVWICHMGRAAQDGRFEEFIKKIQSTQLTFKPDQVRLVSLRGDRIEFGWERPLQVNGHLVSLIPENHMENPYTTASFPCTQMTIHNNEMEIRLNFE